MLTSWVAIAVMLVLFGLSIFVHELGHFWLARRRGMKIERFSIGFGPALWSTRKDGVEYRVSVFPLGGYVLLPQMNPAEALEGRSESDEPLPPVAPFTRIIVALAGPALNVAFGLVIAIVISVNGIPSDESPEMLVVTRVLPDSPEAAAGLKIGDRIEQVDGCRVAKLDDVDQYLMTCTTDTVPFRVRREGEVVNLRIAIKRDPDLGLRVRKFELGESTYIRSVEDGSPARQSGLEVGDKIISANGEPVLNANHLIEIVRGMAGKPVAVEYERKGARLKAAVTPFYDTVKKRARIGIGLGFNPLAPKVIVHPSPLDQLWRPVVNITRTLWALFHPQVTGVTPGKLSGAPGIMYVLTQQIKESIMIGLDWTVFLNVNLAIINLLPLPVLDGGHILFALFEWVRRRPLNVKFVRVTWTGFTALLLAFVLYVSVKDLWMITRISFMKPAATETNVAPAAPAPSPAR